MKNVFMSIFLVLMLTVSMLGNVDLVKAQPVVSLEALSYNPDPAIVEVNNQVMVNFNVVNTGDEDADVVITVGNPYREGSGFLIGQAGNIFEETVVAGTQELAEFTVTGITQTSDDGDYTATITATITGQEDVTTLYTISLENSDPSISVSGLAEGEEFVLTGEEGAIPEDTLTISNNGNRGLTDLQLVFPNNGEFADTEDEIDFSISIDGGDFNVVDLSEPFDLDNINVDEDISIAIRARIPETFDLDTYSGEVSIVSTQFADLSTGLDNDSFNLIVRVEPEICTDGRVSDGEPVDNERQGNIQITDLDVDEDNLNVGETIQVTVDVENTENQDLDVVVEAMLYNLNQNKKIIGWEEFVSEEIEKDTEESYDFDIKIPIDDEDIDPDDTYILYVKASEDGDEDKNCNYHSIEIDVDREDDDVRITRFIMTPIVVSPGEGLLFDIGALNIGTDEQKDVYIKLTSTELDLDMTSTVFDLDKYSKSGNSITRPFEFTVPSDVEAKDYTIEARVYFNNGKDSQYTTATLTVQGEATPEPVVAPPVTQPVTQQPGTYQPTTGASIFDSLGDTKTLFIIGDIVLVVLAVLFLVLIFKRR